MKPIAIVGMACRYPDAADPAELWTNVLAGRRAFRRFPDERMRLTDYWSADPATPDTFYTRNAAVIEGYDFPRVEYKIAGSTFRTTDLTHWLALDTAARALDDAGFAGGDGLPKRNTSVVVGNSLTGEFTRANLMRLRWPYVRRVLSAALREHGWADDELAGFLGELETRYKSPFPPVDEDTLAGGLSNTISGRICSQFGFMGGGFTVDGACSSSLLAVAISCNALDTGQVDAAVAGGVDLSIDPFEVIGFAKTGALATGEMRVYDRNSNGFWPGEGCGMLVLMREEDAQAAGLRIYATIAGWGYASDGKGGITRPEADGHRLAIQRAYSGIGFDFGSVYYVEGHGTGTAVGDATELRAFSQARRDADATAGPAAISTIKGNIGHTKAAAGVAGLIKATMAVHHQVIPPATGHYDPHPELLGRDAGRENGHGPAPQAPALRVPATAELWPADQPVRASVSAMGFGGINTHIALQSSSESRRQDLDPRTIRLVRSRQDQEILLLDATSPAELRHRASHLAELSAKVSYAELGDLAATLEQQLAGRPVRAAVVAGAPEEAGRRFAALASLLEARTAPGTPSGAKNDAAATIDIAGGVFLGSATRTPRIGYLFPGQGSGKRNDGGALARRFETVAELYRQRNLPTGGDLSETAAAQPRIVVSSLAALRVLTMLGIEATGAAGHSLGELTGLHWAGAMDEQALIDLATVRGREMSAAGDGNGAMASLAAGPVETEQMLRGEPVVIAGYNGPSQTVISGPADAVERVCATATRHGLLASRLPVSHAFHSPLIAPAVAGIAAYLNGQRFGRLERQVWSTSTSELLPADTDVPDLLVRQVLEPVRFHQAVQRMAAEVDLLVEVGPGRVLSGLAADIAPATPVVALDADGASLAGLLSATAAAYVLGAPVRHDLLFSDRFTKPLPIDKQFRFFVNPCELAPDEAVLELPEPALAATAQAKTAAASAAQAAGGHDDTTTVTTGDGSLEVLRQLMAQRAELPLEAVHGGSLPLDDLHFSSITVGQIVNQAARELGISVPAATASFATATVADLAVMLDDLASTDMPGAEESWFPDGVAPWVRAFATELVPRQAPPRTAPVMNGEWQVFATADHPLATPLAQALRAARLGDGVLLCLPQACDERHVVLMLAAAHAALASTAAPGRFVVVGGRRGAAGLAKTLHLEAPAIATTVVVLPEPDAALIDGIVADVAATAGFAEVHYDEAGTRHVPLLRPLPDAAPASAGAASAGGYPLGKGDVLLVTGGGKGITAECALAIARQTGAAVGLVGRSDPADDAALAANLSRMEAAGVAYHYTRADVTAPAEVAAAVAEITQVLGQVTGLLHGAGRNEPAPLTQLDEGAFAKTLAPKIGGLEAVLQAVDPRTLKLLVTFGSIIGRAGLRGQADYATANDWLTELTAQIQAQQPDCRCLALEWSVWAGAGMGERLGVLEALARDGISPVSVDDGVDILLRLLTRDDLPTALVIMGRAGDLPTITLEPRELPLARFLDRPRVYYPGIELVVESELSADNDPYLPDHLLDGELLFPAVLGIEAMSQAASALVPDEGPPVLEDAVFNRPIVVPVGGGSTTIRVAALNRGDRVDVVIRSSETDFQADHFRATLRWGVQDDDPLPGTGTPAVGVPAEPVVPLDPARDLYGSVLFQGKRFAHVQAYRSMAATSCVVEISAEPVDGWFSAFFPPGLVLGNPGPRDAFMHAIQCCVPDATLLPQGVERIRPGTPREGVTRVVLTARERSRDGDSYIYDLEVRDPDGELVERWEGLGLRAVRKQDGKGPWVPSLLGPYLERGLMDLYPAATAPRCVVEPDGPLRADGQEAQRSQTEIAVSRLFGHSVEVLHRADGKPELADGTGISASHTAGLTLAVCTGEGRVGCDAELVAERTPDDWELLLGAEHFALAELTGRERGEDLAVAATRVWSAMECLRKLGLAIAAPLTFDKGPRDGWALFVAGDTRIATFATSVRATASPVVFAIATESEAGR